LLCVWCAHVLLSDSYRKLTSSKNQKKIIGLTVFFFFFFFLNVYRTSPPGSKSDVYCRVTRTTWHRTLVVNPPPPPAKSTEYNTFSKTTAWTRARRHRRNCIYSYSSIFNGRLLPGGWFGGGGGRLSTSTIIILTK